MRRSIRREKDRAWFVASDVLAFTYNTDFVDQAQLIVGSDLTEDEGGILAQEETPWYCERIMLTMFPLLGRNTSNNTNERRLWTWAMWTASGSNPNTYAAASSKANADMYNDGSAFWPNAGRVLQQGVRPAYEPWTPAVISAQGGRLAVETASSIGAVLANMADWGESKVEVDHKTKFGLRSDSAFVLSVAPGESDDTWEAGDTLAVHYYIKMLWTHRLE